MFHDRRRLLGLWGAVLGVATSPKAIAQLHTNQNICPPGTDLKSVTIETAVTHQERSITILGIAVTQKVPVRVVRVEYRCDAPPPPPPPPPNPPKGLYDIYDLNLMYLSLYEVMSFRADQFAVALTLPSIVSIASSTAKLTIDATYSNGSTSSLALPLRHDGSVFRFENPSAVDYWAATTGSEVVAARWSLADIAVVGRASGQGSYGLMQRLGPYALNGFVGSVSVSANSNPTANRTLM